MFESDNEVAVSVYNYLDGVLEPCVNLTVSGETTLKETVIRVFAHKYVRGKGLIPFKKFYTLQNPTDETYNEVLSKLSSDIWIDITNKLGA